MQLWREDTSFCRKHGLYPSRTTLALPARVVEDKVVSDVERTQSEEQLVSDIPLPNAFNPTTLAGVSQKSRTIQNQTAQIKPLQRRTQFIPYCKDSRKSRGLELARKWFQVTHLNSRTRKLAKTLIL
ncbi:hypothetical protein CEXT_550941 [Caerostris extrusa]|uniref:Uncharacterized protein n=1 Tax=Caerostris extrusa TaxID=172846 RepID=A0AAV4U5W8_CAEEX|nr:hypothetical protein CEXT_550941 [Caerostris extrusa]